MLARGIQRETTKKQYTVIIEEHIAGEFPVCTDCLYEALELAASSYLNGKFVVGGATPTCRLMMAREEMTGRMTDWREF